MNKQNVGFATKWTEDSLTRLFLRESMSETMVSTIANLHDAGYVENCESGLHSRDSVIKGDNNMNNMNNIKIAYIPQDDNRNQYSQGDIEIFKTIFNSGHTIFTNESDNTIITKRDVKTVGKNGIRVQFTEHEGGEIKRFITFIRTRTNIGDIKYRVLSTTIELADNDAVELKHLFVGKSKVKGKSEDHLAIINNIKNLMSSIIRYEGQYNVEEDKQKKVDLLRACENACNCLRNKVNLI